MPRMDRTGPMGTGPIGRGMGPCGNGQANWGRGRGFCRGAGAARDMIPTAFLPDKEKDILEQQKVWLQTQLEGITHRLQELHKTEESK